MKILYSPCFNNEKKKITYQFQNETIIATIDGQTDSFNLSSFGEGNIFQGIVTTLPYNPISFVERNNGVLEVQLLHFIDEDSTEEEKYPQWIEV